MASVFDTINKILTTPKPVQPVKPTYKPYDEILKSIMKDKVTVSPVKTGVATVMDYAKKQPVKEKKTSYNETLNVLKKIIAPPPRPTAEISATISAPKPVEPITGLIQKTVSIATDEAKKQKYIKDKILKSSILPKYTPYSELQKTMPEEVKKASESYEKDKYVSNYLSQIDKAFTQSLSDIGFDVEAMEKKAALSPEKRIGAVLTGATRGISDQIKNSEDVYTERGMIYYKGIPIAEEFTTKGGKALAETAGKLDIPLNFIGAILPYANISTGIKSIIKNIAKTETRAGMLAKSALDVTAKYPILSELIGYNTAEEIADASIRKTLRQDYTLTDFIKGLAYGAALSGSIMIAGKAYDAHKLKQLLKESEQSLSKNRNIEDLRNIRIGDTTIGNLFQEQHLAYLDKKKMQGGGRPGIERPDEMPIGLSIKDVSKGGKTGTPGIDYPAPLPETKLNLLEEEAKKYKSAEEFVKTVNPFPESKVKDVVYHGTNVKFDIFSKDFIGENQPADFGQGFSFAKDRKSAEGYAKEAGGDIIMEVKLDIKNPAKNKDLLDRDVQDAIDDGMGFKDVGEVLQEKGFDGIEYTRADGTIEYTVFNPEQIKTKSQLTDMWNKANDKLPTTSLKTDKLAYLGGDKKLTPEELYTRDKEAKSQQFKSSVYERLSNEIPPELRESVGYTKENLQINAEKAVELVKADKTEAYRVAMGMKEPPKGQASAIVNIVMSEKALLEGNYELYSKLVKNRSLAQTRRGQEIVAEKLSVTDNSTSRYVKELISARLDKLGKDFFFGLEKIKGESNKQKAIKIIDKEVTKAQEKMSRTKELDIAEAQSIIDKLMCK